VDKDILQQNLQDLYENGPCGFVVTTNDDVIVQVNRTFLNWTGYSREEVLSSMRFQDLLTVPGKLFYENQYSPLLWMQGFVKGVAFEIVCKSRDPLPVLVSSVQRMVADGFPLLTASIVVDATDRREYERELLLARRRAEQLAAVVTAASDAILSMTPDGVVEACNVGAERLFGRAAGELVGRGWRELLPPRGDADYDRILGDLWAGRAAHLETVALRPGGQHIEVSVGLAPHLGLLGELTAISAIVRDISERKALERMQQEFLAMASHELRNPLTAIRGYAQLMRRRGAYNEQSVDGIVAQANRLDRRSSLAQVCPNLRHHCRTVS
jgi:PAS domain S-box-containing protein